MGSGIDLAYSKQELELHGVPAQIFSGTKTATGNTGETPIYVGHFKEASFFLNVTAKSGTTPTLGCKIQTKGEDGQWYDLVTFTQATDVTHEMKEKANCLGEYIRLLYTIGGTTPSFTFTCYGYFKK